MKTVLFALLPFFLFGILTGCGNAKKEQEAAQKELRAEVLAIHDEVMPMMGELAGLAGQIKQILLSEAPTDAELRTKMEAAVEQMEAAEEGMMDWMSNFKQPEGLRSSMTHEAIMEYMEAEKTKISDVSTQIKSGIESGKALLAAYR